MKYFVFSFMVHCLIFVLVIRKNHRSAEVQRESRIIIEIISVNSDREKTDLFSEKGKTLKKSKRKLYLTSLNSSFSKKSNGKSNLENLRKTVVQIENSSRDTQRNLSSEEPGSAEHGSRIKLSYAQQLKTYIEKNKFYPRAALKLNQTGVVKIRLEIAPDGIFKNITIVHASDHENLNKAALKLVKNLRQFKPLPGIFQGSTPFIIPIAYVR